MTAEELRAKLNESYARLERFRFVRDQAKAVYERAQEDVDNEWMRAEGYRTQLVILERAPR